MDRNEDISVVIPTYRREGILLDMLRYLCELTPAPEEIILVDQTENHQSHVYETLVSLEKNGHIRWIRLSEPSIPHAMNVGLQEAKNEIVLFLDDDIIPDEKLIEAHLRAHAEGHNIVAGQVLQPGEEPLPDAGSGEFGFCSKERQLISEVMAGNFSIKKELALALGGFDENFVHVAYRFETEFAERALDSGETILFEPAASIRHLKAQGGGTRSFGEHFRTIKPSHSVGAYYFLLMSKSVKWKGIKVLRRAFRAVRTRHHLYHPWWILPTLISEMLGFVWAIFLIMHGPRYITSEKYPK